MTKECPETVKMRAIDVKPHRWSQWCSIGEGEPFANPIVSRTWSEDGKSIWFMLDSHNFFEASPDEELELVPYMSYMSGEMLEEVDKRDAEKMAKRPSKKTCPTCGAEK